MTKQDKQLVRDINDKVCRLRWTSPLCWDYDQLKYIVKISNEHELDPNVLIGISYAESWIWTNFAPTQDCSRMNNRGWIKAKKKDDWTTEKYKLPYSWCRLYPFKDMNAYWDSLANTIRLWYVDAWCDNLSCLSAYYVGKPWQPKSSWIVRINWYLDH